MPSMPEPACQRRPAVSPAVHSLMEPHIPAHHHPPRIRGAEKLVFTFPINQIGGILGIGAGRRGTWQNRHLAGLGLGRTWTWQDMDLAGLDIGRTLDLAGLGPSRTGIWQDFGPGRTGTWQDWDLAGLGPGTIGTWQE